MESFYSILVVQEFVAMAIAFVLVLIIISYSEEKGRNK